jgi:anthranilate/para-aminobenzoate synthase component II
MFYDTASRVLDHALSENDAGRPFPVLGICLGFETLMILVAGGIGLEVTSPAVVSLAQIVLVQHTVFKQAREQALFMFAQQTPKPTTQQ